MLTLTFVLGKSKGRRKPASKKPELNQKSPTVADADVASSSTTSTSSTAFASPATTPDATTSKLLESSLTLTPAEKPETNHLEAKTETAEPEVTSSSPPPEVATSNHVLEEPEAEAVKEDSATLSKSGSALKLRYTYSDGKFRASFAASIQGTSNATLVLKGLYYVALQLKTGSPIVRLTSTTALELTITV